eukprot:m.276556 g.276556  ORF g.276556 m.276556 type:complete len:62 (-) comp55978_c0_seq1:34-219(-)
MCTAGTTPNTVITAAAGYCNLGARISPDEFFTGAISAVYMYNRALSNAEIQAIYVATRRTF